MIFFLKTTAFCSLPAWDEMELVMALVAFRHVLGQREANAG